MSRLRRRIARRNAIRQSAAEHDVRLRRVAKTLDRIAYGHDTRKRKVIDQGIRDLRETLRGDVDPDVLDACASVYSRTRQFTKEDQTYGPSFWNRIYLTGLFRSTAWTDQDRGTFQSRVYAETDFRPLTETGGWDQKTLREAARDDRTATLLFQEFLGQTLTSRYESFSQDLARRAVDVLLGRLHRGAELLAEVLPDDVQPDDREAAAKLLLALFAVLSEAERRQQAENERKRRKRAGEDPGNGTIDSINSGPPNPVFDRLAMDDRIGLAIRLVPFLAGCGVDHLAAALGVPQKRFRTLVKAHTNGIQPLPDTDAEYSDGDDTRKVA